MTIDRGEVWRPVPGWENAYSVSDRGRVRSEQRRARIGGGHHRTVSERILRSTPAGWVCLCRGGQPHWIPVDKLVAQAFGPQQDDLS